MNFRSILIRFKQSKFFPIAVILLLACLLEITIFNCKHWSSAFAKKSDSFKVEFGNAFIKQDDGTFLIGEGDQTIDFSDINVVLKSSLIDIDIVKGDEGRFYSIPIWQAVTDFSHDEFYGIGERVIYPELKRSEYLLYHLYGEAHELRIGLNIPVGTVISVNTEINPHVPIMFSFKRFVWVVLFFLFMYVFRPSSGLYRITYLKIPYKLLLLILILFFVFNASVFNYLSNVNPFFQWERGDSQEQYQLLADAIRGGKFSLDIEVPQILKNLDNPYDRIQRERAFEGTGQWYRWDHAYYNGKYYVYFGVVPVLVFYLPALIITGIQLSNHTAVFFASLLLLLGLLGTLHEFIKKWFPKLSLGMWLLLTESLLLGSNTIYMLKRPDLYTVPIITGLAFGFLGLWFFLQSMGKEEIRYGFVAVGSLFTALVAGCRPQLFLIFAFFFVLYSPVIFNKTRLISPEGGKLALELFVPMFAVALFLMFYNFKRFGSPFDFGANYNLNFNDMRHRGWVWGRVPLGLWASLLQPVKIIQNFPFEERVFFNPNYPGITIQEATFGGLLANTPFAWIGLSIVFFFRRYFKLNKKASLIGLISIISAIVIIMIDVEGAGILIRYFNDFSIFFMLASFLASCMLLETATLKKKNMFELFVYFILIAFAVRLIHEGMTFFLDTGEALEESRFELYAVTKTLTAFWL